MTRSTLLAERVIPFRARSTLSFSLPIKEMSGYIDAASSANADSSMEKLSFAVGKAPSWTSCM